MPDMASMQAMLQQNPEMVSAMMDNPMVQQALENPGELSSRFCIKLHVDACHAAIIEAMMQANPQMRSIMESNPEVAQIMRDPALIRQVLALKPSFPSSPDFYSTGHANRSQPQSDAGNDAQQ